MGGKAVCLISGGMDSALTTAIAKKEGDGIYALTFDYSQRHRKEIENAKKIARYYNAVEHKIFRFDLTQIRGSALTDEGIDVPEGKPAEDIRSSKEIPLTYVPARNTILLSFALAYAEVVDADAIYIGANHLDYSGYPDCRPEYFKAYQNMVNLATRKTVEGRGMEIRYPIIEYDKRQIVEKSVELNVPLHLTWSCYKGDEKACGRCDSCVLRLKGFKEAGVADPLEYE